ncbi:MAG: FHA domain-containing protein, partial [Myxococcota bacterium]
MGEFQSETIMIVVAVALVLGVLYYILTRSQAERDSKRQPYAPSASSTVRRNWLVGQSGSVKGKNYHIGSRSVTIGRGIGNYVQITDPNASRIHCKLSPVPYGLEVRDNESRNGTLINRERITVQVLKDGDELKIGDDSFIYRAEGNFGDNAGLKRKAADARVGKA